MPHFRISEHYYGKRYDHFSDMEGSMEIKTVTIENPDGLNMILGHSHFIKTVEDVYEIMVTTVPMAKFALAFCEASDKCLVRHSMS
jgi:adenosine/AMP kinase